jgi:hypothetical protein
MAYKILVVDQTSAGAALKTVLTPESSIADAVAITGGEAPTEAEYNLLVTKINTILDVLDAAGLTA